MKKTSIIPLLGKLIGTLALLFAALYAGVLLMLFVMMYVHSPLMLNVLGAIYVLFILFLCSRIWNRRFRVQARRIFLLAEGAALAVLLGCVLYNAYIERIPSVGDHLNLNNYKPFQGEQVAALREPSTLQLRDQLPRIDCATALYPVVSAFVQASYPQDEYPWQNTSEVLRASVFCSGTAGAYKNLIHGESDIIFVAGASEAQLQFAVESGVELIFTPIGKEAFVFFVNQKNPIDSLTIDEIRGIYSGEITNWSELGGESSTIRAFQRSADSGSQTALAALMDGTPLMQPPAEDVVGMMEGIIKQVSDYKNYKNAIGFSFRFFSTEMVQSNEIKLLNISGISPCKETIRDGSYPISAEFFAVTRADCENPNVQLFLDWILSPQGQLLIEETGYVGIS